MPAMWFPYGVGPRDDELFVGETKSILNSNRFDPKFADIRGSVPREYIRSTPQKAETKQRRNAYARDE